VNDSTATMQELLRLEEGFWRAAGNRERYEANLAPDAVHVFPGWGVTDLETVLASVAEVDPWETFTIDKPHLVALADDVAALVYTARAKRAGRDPYLAAMTSVYRRMPDGWELVLHQQTPLPDAAGDA
jgi:hypothetical protein